MKLRRASLIALCASLAMAGFACADQQDDKSEFRIYYYNSSGLVFDEGHGVREYNDALRYMNKHMSPRNGWDRFKPLCGKLVAASTCAKFDADLNRPGADYFCSHLPDYAEDTLKGMGENDVVAIEDLCEANHAANIRPFRVRNQSLN